MRAIGGIFKWPWTTLGIRSIPSTREPAYSRYVLPPWIRSIWSWWRISPIPIEAPEGSGARIVLKIEVLYMNLLGIALSLLVLWLWYTRQESFADHDISHIKYIVLSKDSMEKTSFPVFNWEAPIDMEPIDKASETDEARRGLSKAYDLLLEQERVFTIPEIMVGHPGESGGTSLHMGEIDTENIQREDIRNFTADQIPMRHVNIFSSLYGE